MRLGDSALLEELDSLHWGEFEALVAELFKRLGYETDRVGGVADCGADVIASRKHERVAIQAKHRSDRRWVGQHAVQAVVASLPVYDCSRAVVVTNSTFAPNVRRLADLNGVELWDRDRLESELLSFCSLCGNHVGDRVRDWCLGRPDQYRGRVYCFRHQRHPRGLLRLAAGQ